MADIQPGVSWPWENSFQPTATPDDHPTPLMHETGPLGTNAGPSDPVGIEEPGLPIATSEERTLSGDTPGVATEKPAESKVEHSPEAKSRLDKLLDELEQEPARLRAIYQERERRLNPYYDEVLNTIKERGKVQIPPLQPLPQPPTFQSHLNSARNDFLGLAVLFGAIGLGRRSAGGLTTALNAFAGIAEGFKASDKEAVTQQMDRWKAAMDYTIKANKNMTDQYKAILEAQDRDLDNKLQLMKLVAAQEGDKVAEETLRNGNIMDMAKIIAENEKGQIRMRMLDLQADKIEATLKAAQAKVDSKNNPTMSEEALNELIDEYHATGRRPQLSVFGFRQAGDANRQAFQALLTERIKTENWGANWQRKAASDWTAEMAGARTGGVQVANLDLILRRAAVAIPLAEQASQNVPRGSLVRLNALQLRGEQEISDPRVRDFAIKNLQVAEVWAQAMNPKGHMRIDDRNLALENLRIQEGQGSYSAALAAVKQFVLREIKATQGFREHTPVEEGEPLAPIAPKQIGPPPPPAAIQHLKAHPELRSRFDEKYGQGAADRALSGQ